MDINEEITMEMTPQDIMDQEIEMTAIVGSEGNLSMVTGVFERISTFPMSLTIDTEHGTVLLPRDEKIEFVPFG